MKKWITLTLATLIAVPAFATTEDAVISAEETSAQLEIEATAEGLIPADQLDSLEIFALERRDPRDRDPRDRDPGRRDPRDPRDRDPGRRPPPHRPPPRPWVCVARDRIRVSYRSEDHDLQRARREAMWKCERQTRVGRCYLVGCDRR